MEEENMTIISKWRSGIFRVMISGILALLLASPALPAYNASAASTDTEVSVTLGAAPIENGIHSWAGDNPNGLQTGTINGKTYWQTKKSVGTAYLYMNVDDGFLYNNTDQDVYVTVEYLDQGNGSIVLQYDSDSAAFKDAPLFTYENSGQWKTYTFKLGDAKFANRANGSDFRVGVEGAGAPANVADLILASVTVKKKPKINVSAQTAVVQTEFPTDDIAIANFNAKDFGAVGDGAADDTQAVQDALDAAGNSGGGVVFVPLGRYKISGNLVIPTGVTLRGDWKNPETGGVAGTVLEAFAGRGNENDTSFIQMRPSSGLIYLSIWYPEQTLDQPAAYPWTIEQLSGDSVTVNKVTLVNSYNGIKIGPVWNELHYVNQVYGTALKTGIFLDFTTDIGRLEHVNLSPSFWANSGLPGSPGREALFNYTTTHSEGIVMGRSDWEYMSDISISGFRTGLRITSRTGSQETANAQLFKIRVEDCNVALKIEGVNDFGLLVSDSTFKASVGEMPISIYATPGFHSIAQFNTVTVGGSPLHAALNEGSGVLSFENSTFENWNDQAGGYAIVAEGGSVILGQTAFSKPERHLLLQNNVQSLKSINSGYQGTLKVNDQSDAAELDIHQDTRYQLERLPEIPRLDKSVRPKPATNRLFDVTAAPYHADKNGGGDSSSAIQQALNAAGAAGGGTVYLPAGIYRIEQPITVPIGVELRGSWDVPHHTIGGGTVIFTNYGANDAAAAPLISLEASAGIRGLSVYYDQQDWNQVKIYPWTIQGKGHDVYAIDTTLINPYQGIDFGSHDTSGHYIDYVAGSPLKEGIFLGGGSSGGFMRNVQFNPHYYGRNAYPNHPSTDADSQKVWNYQKENLDAFRIGNVTSETVFNTFVFGSQYGIHFTSQEGRGPEAVIIGHGTDGSKKGAYLESAGPGGLSFINTELVSISTTDKVYVTTGGSFNSRAAFFNTSMWGDTTRSFDIQSGKVRIQQSNFTRVGERGINALGGDITLYDSYFQQDGTTHVYAGPDIERMVITNNLFKGGLQIVNHAPGKVSGTDIVPVSLELLKSPFNEAEPEKTNVKLLIKNISEPQPLNGTIQLLQPNKLTPIRFHGVGLGESATIDLPYLASDALKYQVTLDNGYSHIISAKLGQSFASHASGKLPDAPSIDLSRSYQYFSLGGRWKGVNDLSATSTVKWDDYNLYVSVAVHDDVHHQTWSNGDIWQGDSIQLGIDLSRKDGSSSRNVNELGFALDSQGTVTQWRWRAPDGLKAGALMGTKATIARDDTRGMTVYQITIPIDQLHGPGYLFNSGDPIGFTLLVNDNDGAGRSGFMEYNGGIGTSKDAMLYGDLHLLRGSFTELLEQSAETAVKTAKKQEDVTNIDAAVNFVELLPEGQLKTKLFKELDKILSKKK
jgi:hypothetical protein